MEILHSSVGGGQGHKVAEEIVVSGDLRKYDSELEEATAPKI